MGFASTINNNGVPNHIGDMKMTTGTYTSDGGSTGGNIDTGLRECVHLQLQANDTSVETNAPVVNETLPAAGSAITIVTDANEVGYWVAFGY